eukprot:CAMPEP_0197031462 /NCGR_PEP_ID=MMETSP1384-20130603/10465_1 /TAXON_ID=29189 /ORGANISM="Ammonia sp." /LENGTH=70 /DNA_ID=CAMNT_0042460995 /DNA_START=78 /DNA_END=287 /DNA_ORIENTATION=+
MLSFPVLSCVILTIHSTAAINYGNNNGHTEHRGDCDEDWSDLTNYDKEADRIYYIACVDVEWDYAPSGKN